MSQYTKPTTGDYSEYFEHYLEHLVGDERDVLIMLREQGRQVLHGLQQITNEQANHRYAPDKWSVKEVIGHLIDTERLFAFRALWIARGETNVQPGMDENLWTASSNAHARSTQDIWQEFESTRSNHLHLFRSFDSAALTRTGLSGGSPTMVNAFPWLIAAHERHHLVVLRDRYGFDFLENK